MNTRALFGSNPALQETVDKATSEYLVATDWEQNMNICDSVNANISTASQIVEALTFRINNTRNIQVISLTITLAETLVKNCGSSLHKAIASKEFMDALTNVALGKKGGGEAQAKALEIIQSWGQSFENMKGSLPLFYETYISLKVKGVNFPAASASAPPIFTPARSVSSDFDEEKVANIGGRTSDPFDKLRANSSEVKGKITLLESLIAARSRGDIGQSDDSLLDTIDYLEQCKVRILVLIEAGVTGALPEDLLAVFFQLNDDIERVLARNSKGDDGNVANTKSKASANIDDDFSKLARRNSEKTHDPFAPIASTSSPTKSRKSEPDFFAAMGLTGAATAPPAPVPAARYGNPFDDAYAAAPLPAQPVPTPSTSKSAKKYDDEFDEFLH